MLIAVSVLKLEIYKFFNDVQDSNMKLKYLHFSGIKLDKSKLFNFLQLLNIYDISLTLLTINIFTFRLSRP